MNHSIPSELQSLRIELLSDTTFGRGEGTAGQVDVEVDHDELGIPFVNGKTIRSLLRDTWLSMQEQFPKLMDAGRRVFGPHGELDETSILRIGRAGIDDESRRWISAAVERNVARVSSTTILAGFTDIRTQTSEDRATGAPELTTLRSMRVLIRGLVLTAELDWLEIPTADDVRCLALSLLGTRHAGLCRNRGRGHIRCGFGTIDSAEDSVKRTAQWASGNGGSPTSSQCRHPLGKSASGLAAKGNSPTPGVWYVPYTLTLKSPAIVTGLAHDPNTVSTLRYIPGSMLRGAVARAIGNHAATRAQFNSLVLGGNVAWLNAYPLHQQSRTLPAPPGFKRDKQQADDEKRWDVFDLASFDGQPDETHELEDEDGNLHWPEESLAGTGESFVTFVGTPTRITPNISARVHQQRDRAKGRSWTDTSQGGEQPHGTLFACESLDAKQKFEGAIQIRADSEAHRDAILQQVRSLLGYSVLLGRSRRAEYGGDAEIEFRPDPNRRREWPELGREDIPAGKCFRAMLVSPCLVRDPDTGQFDPAALRDVIEQKFAGRAKVQWVRTSFETVGGFNRKWRLELPQTLAVSTGSVVVLQATADISTADIVALENAGLGDRRAEGFGRFVITKHEPNGKLTLTRPDEIAPPDSLTSSPPTLIKELQARLALTALERAIDETASDVARNAKKGSLPSSSLIGRLRELLRDQSSDATCSKALSELNVWLRSADESRRLKKPAMDKLDRCRVGSKSLTSWLLEVIDSPTPRDLNLPGIAARCRLISQESSGGDDPALAVLCEPSSGSGLPDSKRQQGAAVQVTDRQLSRGPNWLKVRLIDAVLDQMALLNRQQTRQQKGVKS